MTQEILSNAAGLDLSPRVVSSVTVAASPAAGAETIVASIQLPGDIPVVSAVDLIAVVNFTVGTNGVSARLRIKQTDASGIAKADTGALTAVAANLMQAVAAGRDAAPAAQQVYVATLLVGSGSAASTVSSLILRAIIV